MKTDPIDVAPSAPPAPPPTRKTAEDWARAKGHVRKTPARALVINGVRREPSQFSVEFDCAKAFHRWPVGKELTEAEYDAAIDAALRCEIR